VSVKQRWVFVLVGAVVATAWTCAWARRSRDRDREPKRYYVVRVMGMDREITFEVVGDIDYRDKVKDAEEEFRDAAIDWKKARREAKKNGEDFDEKPPIRPKFKKIKSFKDEDDADSYAERYQERWDRMMAKKRAKRGEKDDDFLDDGDDDDKDKKGKKQKKGDDDDDKPKKDDKDDREGDKKKRKD